MAILFWYFFKLHPGFPACQQYVTALGLSTMISFEHWDVMGNQQFFFLFVFFIQVFPFVGARVDDGDVSHAAVSLMRENLPGHRQTPSSTTFSISDPGVEAASQVEANDRIAMMQVLPGGRRKRSRRVSNARPLEDNYPAEKIGENRCDSTHGELLASYCPLFIVSGSNQPQYHPIQVIYIRFNLLWSAQICIGVSSPIQIS